MTWGMAEICMLVGIGSCGGVPQESSPFAAGIEIKAEADSAPLPDSIFTVTMVSSTWKPQTEAIVRAF